MRKAAFVGAIGLAVVAAGCGVKQGAVDEQLANLREEMRSEMQAGDQQVAANTGRRIDSLGRRVTGLERDLEAFRREFNAQVTQMQGMLRFNVPVHFGYDNATLREQDRPILDRFAQIVRDHYQSSMVTVEGFADPAGSAEYNRGLGMRRAEAVKAHLTRSGQLAANQVRAVSYGEDRNRQVKPGIHGPGDQGWENRRVTLVIDHAGEAGMRVSQQSQ
jgi:peptidoglycan-associated lipoprotein